MGRILDSCSLMDLALIHVKTQRLDIGNRVPLLQPSIFDVFIEHKLPH